MLLTTLLEASDTALADLKRVLSKDNRVKMILTKSPSIDEISNPAEFLSTLKFLVLNNRNVLEFVQSRSNVDRMSVSYLKTLREIRPEKFTQQNLDALHVFVTELIRESAKVADSKISASARKELVSWANGDGRFFDLSRATQRELLSVPGVRPTKPIVLYRGLLFSGYDLKERRGYDNQMDVGKGLKFLRSVREGSRVVNLEWDRPSSWSTSREVAMRFARFGSASDNFGATMQWLQRGTKHIDGDLGFILSYRAQPEDVLIDMRRLQTSAHLTHGDEGEVILRPGKITCRVQTKYTPEGEVDPVIKKDDAGENLVQEIRKFYSTWMQEHEFDVLRSGGWSAIDLDRLIDKGATDAVRALMTTKVKTDALREFDALKKFFHEHLQSLSPETLQSLLVDEKTTPLGAWVKKVREFFDENRQHSALKSDSNPRGRVKAHELTPEQHRETMYTNLSDSLKTALRAVDTKQRFDKSTRRDIDNLHRALTGKSLREVPYGEKDGAKDQALILQKTLEAFFDLQGKQMPESREEAIAQMRSGVLAAERNARFVNHLLSLQDGLKSAINGESE